ncbi:MAG TPA: sigma-54 dependent transcriptional regulator [Kofleriaceae bacterium]|nr:sigma-54 dependent transcriptional regulator [Kofleriaceae bacterium]
MEDAPDPGGLRVLLIDDDEAIARSVARLFRLHDITVEHVGALAQIEELLSRPDATEAWDVILLDVNLPNISGLDILRRLRANGATASVVMLTGDDSASTATEALRAGAYHYIVKPMLNNSLIDVVTLAARQTEVVRHTQHAKGSTESDVLVGDSQAMRGLRTSIQQIARTPASVLIIGESGTGKELVARTLHRLSDRSHHMFVPLNCGAIPEGLIDSELFGHTRGAFTGATSARPGVFVEADGGTLFLDEIGDMPAGVQVRLLRALQEREVKAVGADAPRPVDVRVVAATHVDLTRAVADGKFRSDLFFRLNVVTIRVPPLRERRDDIPALVARLLRRHGGSTIPELAPDALEAILGYHWPGNVRELENAIQHAIALAGGERIEVRHLPAEVIAASRFAHHSGPIPISGRGGGGGGGGDGSGSGGSDPGMAPAVLEDGLSLTDAKRKAAADFEKAYLERVLEHAKGSISAASRIAGIDRTNFRRLLQRHGIDSTRYRS